jgi:AcrR family transcriptional regulator
MATRPRDRKAQIARASAEAFSTLGYHRVTMEDIASRVGVTATALYRHYSGKYELFRGAVLSLGQQLVDATEAADAAATGDPHGDLDRLVAALTNTALANRESGGLYRWEARFLTEEDQRELDAQVRSVHRRLHRPLAVLHPDASTRVLWTTSTALLSVLGSIVDHRARLSANRVRALLAEFAAAIATADIVVPDDAPPRVPPRTPRTLPKYEALLDEAMRLFHTNGYRDTSVEQIAAAVGLPASGVYRYFSRKSDLLAASFRRAADWMSAEISAIAASSTDPEDALVRVIDSYVGRSFDLPELAYVYYTEKLNLPTEDQAALRSMQRSTVESWVEIVAAVRSDWTAAEARFAVHAAMALVVDIGRLTEYRDSVAVRAMLSGLLDLTLLGRYRLRIALPAK